jgi:uncharacterized protein YbjQ (UPF0145 family)
MFELIVLVCLMTLGYVFGSMNERRHYKSIQIRERKYRNLFVHNVDKRHDEVKFTSQLVAGNVVVSVDYFKQFVAGLRNLFGGKVSSYESLLDRGRREAMLRLQEQGIALGAVNIINIRYETASISQNAQQNVGSIEVLAYGTALIPRMQEQ